MKNLNLKNIEKAVNGVLKNYKNADLEKEASCVEIDSRKIKTDGVFIATVGARVDGHSFVAMVEGAGALCAIVEHDVECSMPYIVVNDSFQALKDLAKFYREQVTIPVIGVTGSVGKTSTKEFIAGTLSAKYKVLKTQGNFNNEVGMPLTLLSIRDEHEIAVVEMGISDFGEMSRLTHIAKPDTCIITNIGHCHLENLIDRNGVLKAKTEIFEASNPDGAVFFNGDDDKLREFTSPGNREVVYYGENQENDIYPSNIVSNGLLGSTVTINIKENGSINSIDVEIPQPGKHMVVNSLVAAGVAKEYGLSNDEIIKGIYSVEPMKGRSHIVDTGRYVILDDCYNANPVSMKTAITLLDLALNRKVAILGDMFELGEKEKEMHYEIGEYVVKNNVDVLISIGELSKSMYEGAEKANSHSLIYHFDTVEEAYDSLGNILKKDDSILIKASHGMHFENIVEFLMK